MDIKIKELLKKIKDIFKIASTIGKNIGFEKRKSKMDALRFLKASIIAFIEKEKPSFNDLAMSFYDISGSRKKISRQGFWYRITPTTVEYLKTFLLKLMEKVIDKMITVPKLLKDFKEVYLIDSTVIELPETLKDDYKGFGGDASKSAMRIQCIYNVFRRAYEKITIGDIRLSDTKFINSVADKLKKSGLLIFDLGYTIVDALKKMSNKGSYFLCKFPYYNWTLYDIKDKNKKLDLLTILNNHSERIVEFVAYVTKYKLPVRIVAFPLPKYIRDEVIKERLKKAKMNRKYKYRKKISQDYKNYLSWTIFMTNAPSDMIKTRDITLLYRLRWCIELIFKLWKKYFKINDIESKKKEKVEYYVYVRLIVLCFYSLLGNVATDMINAEYDDFDYSLFSCVNIFKKKIPELLLSLDKPRTFSEIFNSYVGLVVNYGRQNSSSSRNSILIELDTHSKGGYMIFYYNNVDISSFYSQFQTIDAHLSKSSKVGFS